MNFSKEHLFALIWLAFGKILAVLFMTSISKIDYFQKRKLYTRENIKSEQSSREWKGLMLVPTDAVILLISIQLNLISFSKDNVQNFIYTLFAMFIWVDLWMYFTHRWMHRSRILWRSHKHHHLSRVTQPSTAISFSFVEKFIFYSVGWIGGISLISWFVPVTFYGIIAYFSAYFFLSPGSHGNIAYYRDDSELLLSPAIHGMHHLQPNVNFGFWTTFYDRVFGTYESPSKSKIYTK